MNYRLCVMVIRLLLAILFSNTLAAQALTVRYPAVQDPYYSARDVYFVKLLEMALSESKGEYQLQGIKYPSYSENRSVLFLKAGEYDVHWLNTTAEREAEVEPIKIPLYKGVIGWRAFFIKDGRQQEFDKTNNVEDLQKYVFVQGHDWADIDILKNSDLKVEVASNWTGLFKMIDLKRADIFPRSIIEIEEENNKFGDGLIIENKIVLQYPSAYYFFVNKSNLQLKTAIENGLKAIVADGRFDRLFFDTIYPKIVDLDVENRRIIKIDRPSLKASMPLENKALWFSVDWFSWAKNKYIVNP